MKISTIELEKVLKDREEEVESVIKSFLDLKDNRYAANIYYSLEETLFLVLCAQLCGCESFREYEAYGKVKIDFLQRYLPYKYGTPSHSTIGRILAIFEPGELERRFIDCMQSIIGFENEGMKDNQEVKQENNEQEQNTDIKNIIAIDGKTHCGFKKKNGDNSVHIVSAFSTSHSLTLGQVKVATKTNEITAIPNLLDMIHIAGQIVTIDAAGCQIEIARKIRSKGADYILALKGNQGSLHEAVIDYFEEPDKLQNCSFCERHSKGHGRIEHRQCYAAQPKVPEAFEKWQDLKTIVMLKSSRVIKGVEQKETRYFISSLEADAQKILPAIRLHWGIENNAHWVLDVIFKEDDRIIWNQNIAYNESIIRRIGLNLLKAYQKIAQPLVRSDKIALKSIKKLIIADDVRMGELLKCF